HPPEQHDPQALQNDEGREQVPVISSHGPRRRPHDAGSRQHHRHYQRRGKPVPPDILQGEFVHGFTPPACAAVTASLLRPDLPRPSDDAGMHFAGDAPATVTRQSNRSSYSRRNARPMRPAAERSASSAARAAQISSAALRSTSHTFSPCVNSTWPCPAALRTATTGSPWAAAAIKALLRVRCPSGCGTTNTSAAPSARETSAASSRPDHHICSSI